MHFQQLGLADIHVLALLVELVGLRHQPVEHFHRHRHEIGMRDPGAVMPVAGLAFLVGLDLGEGRLVGGRVVLDRESAPPCRPWRRRRGDGRS